MALVSETVLDVAGRPAPQLDAMTEVLVQGGTTPSRGVAPLLLWGEDDHLPGTDARSARKLQASWPGAKLTFVPRAGHLPQVENAPAFVEGLVAFTR